MTPKTFESFSSSVKTLKIGGISMDQLTLSIRHQGWMQMLRAQKESGLSVKQWCQDNHISENCYYYRQQKLRESVGEALCRFVEIQQPQAAQHNENLNNSAAQIVSGQVVIGLNNNASEELIGRIVRVLNAQ